MKKNKAIVDVSYYDSDTKVKNPSSLPIYRRLEYSIDHGIPFNAANTTTGTSLDWFGDYYIVYHDTYPIAVGMKHRKPFMFRVPFHAQDLGEKWSRTIKFLDDDPQHYYYYDTSSATRLGNLGVWLSYKKACVGRERNEKTGRMNNVYARCPQITITGNVLPIDEFIDDSPEIKKCCKSVKVIPHSTDLWETWMNDVNKDKNYVERSYSNDRGVATLLESPCDWYFTLDGCPIPQNLIPEHLFKSLEGWRTRSFTTPFNRKSKTNPMKTAHTTDYIDSVVNSFDKLFEISAIRRFISVFGHSTIDRDASTKAYHPQAIRMEPSISVPDLLDSYYHAKSSVKNASKLPVDPSALEFYSKFNTIVPVLEYLCTDEGLMQQDADGLAEMEVYDFSYQLSEPNENRNQIPENFGLSIRLNQTTVKFKFSDDLTTVSVVEGDETIPTSEFVDWIRRYFNGVRKSTTFDLDEI